MVSQQATQDGNPSTDWTGVSDDSVRITAEDRRRIEVDLLTRELARYQVIADNECKDLKNLRRLGLPLAQAERRAATAIGIAQYLGSTLQALGGNRDFAQVTR